MLRIGVVDGRTRDAVRRLATGGAAPVLIGTAAGDADRDADWHLVISGTDDPDGATDVHVERPEHLAPLWRTRLVPYAANLAASRRAPRRQQPVLVGPDPARAATAHRIGARLRRALGPLARRVDHIGSTSVPDLPAEDVIDLQVVVDTLPDADRACGLAVRAGLVPVRGGDFYAIDRHDRRHPERILVDADPGRPVNVHLHPAPSPVWREVLVFRDWLRSDPSARGEYSEFKRALAARPGTDVDDHGRAKRAWVNHAVDRAHRWAVSTGSAPAAPPGIGTGSWAVQPPP